MRETRAANTTSKGFRGGMENTKDYASVNIV